MSLNDTAPWTTMMASCRDASEVIIVAPYMKTEALARVLERISPNATLTCVSRWTPQDVSSGATDLGCRALAHARNGEFLLHNRLHAKYYRFDDQVLIGSANLTGTGMSLAGHGNLEILCHAPPQFVPEQFEADLLSKAFPVSDNDFALWSQITPVRPRSNETAMDVSLDLESWKPTTRRPEYLWLAHQKYSEQIPSDEQLRLAEAEIAFLGIPPNVSESEFTNLVKLNLLASPFTRDVMATTGQPIETAWETISDRWGISKQEAAQSIATAEYWITHFAPDRIITR